ncbi:MAG: hypothetical protein ROO76_03935 [Terriglobia bacterium]|nr:hypothetical protein [Terriglobia bacterium]
MAQTGGDWAVNIEVQDSKRETLFGEATALRKPSVPTSVLVYLVVFLSAFLLFQVELVIAKYILPWFGGTPAVFTTCMLVFQILLLLGYGYAFILESYASPRVQMVVHGLVTASAFGLLVWQGSAWHVPLLPDQRLRPPDSLFPIWHIFVVLLLSVALPFFLLSTTGPLLQAWWGRMNNGLPYKLYALSNAGSVIALLTYPVLFEPHSTLRTQAVWWSVSFLLFGCGAVTVACIAAQYPVFRPSQSADTEHKPSWRRKLVWLLLSCCGSILFLATTNQICQEVAVVPFLWVLPLSLYLLSFVLCFGVERHISRGLWVSVLATATVVISVALYERGISVPVQILIYSFALFAGCLVCHGELVRAKPSTKYLTGFYLNLAAGAAFGAVCVTLISPLIFEGYWEFHLGLWLCWALLCALSLLDTSSWIYLPKPLLLAFCALTVFAGPLWAALKTSKVGLVIGIVAIVILLGFLLSSKATLSPATKLRAALFSAAFTLVLLGAILFFPAIGYLHGAVAVSRNFYGVLSVMKSLNVASPALFLRHGRTLHGFQYADASQRMLPTGYYGPQSGIGLVLRDRINASPAKPLRIGVIGLGVGTIAAYARRDDSIRFYEINPDVVRLAYSGPERLFTYLHDCHGHVSVVMGDARVSLERELAQKQPGDFDVLAIDAFSGDNIPVHLLTREALAVYLRHLNSATGILAFHISNRSLDLSPVVAALAASVGREAWLVDSMDPENGRSVWVLVGKFPGPLSSDMVPLNVKPGFPVWTDDYSSLFAVLR